MAIVASNIVKKGAPKPRLPSRSLKEIHKLGWRSHSDDWLVKKRSEYISDISSINPQQDERKATEQP